MRGQFIRGDGLIVPNNISLAGSAMILVAAFRNTVPTFFAALVTGVPDADMTVGDMVEPTIGVNGYDRIAITRDASGWPDIGVVGAERFISTDWLEWLPVTGNFNQPTQRVALLGTSTYNSADDVWALSAPIPAPITLTPTTTLSQRRWKYQIFL